MVTCDVFDGTIERRVEQVTLAQEARVLVATIVKRAAVDALLVVAFGCALARRLDVRETLVLRVYVHSDEQPLIMNQRILFFKFI